MRAKTDWRLLYCCPHSGNLQVQFTWTLNNSFSQKKSLSASHHWRSYLHDGRNWSDGWWCWEGEQFWLLAAGRSISQTDTLYTVNDCLVGQQRALHPTDQPYTHLVTFTRHVLDNSFHWFTRSDGDYIIAQTEFRRVSVSQRTGSDNWAFVTLRSLSRPHEYFHGWRTEVEYNSLLCSVN